MRRRTLYEGNTPESEIDALMSLYAHHAVAMKFISKLKEPLNIFNKTFIDVGSGPSPLMSIFALSSGCKKYIALDREEVLKHIEYFYLKMAGTPVNYLRERIALNITDDIDGDSIQNLICESDFKDKIFHMQMVLMHIKDQDKRKSLIKEILMNGKVALFTEPDWASMNYKEGILYDFKIAMKELFNILGINGDYGQVLVEEVREVVEENGLLMNVLEVPITISDEEVGRKCYEELISSAERGIQTLNGKFKDNKNDELLFWLYNIKSRLLAEKPEANRPIFYSVVAKCII